MARKYQTLRISDLKLEQTDSRDIRVVTAVRNANNDGWLALVEYTGDIE